MCECNLVWECSVLSPDLQKEGSIAAAYAGRKVIQAIWSEGRVTGPCLFVHDLMYGTCYMQLSPVHTQGEAIYVVKNKQGALGEFGVAAPRSHEFDIVLVN